MIAAAAAGLVLALPCSALANGDPPSDVLPAQDVYFPFQPKPSPTVATALKVTLKRARAAGYPLHVAIVATPADLGDVPQLFGKPQQYADFLAPEIAFQVKGPLLVVMPGGYGTHNAGNKAAQALTQVGAPSGDDSDALPRAAIFAAAKMATAAGHPVTAPRLPGSGSSGGSGLLPIAVLGGLAALGGALAVRKRQAT